MRKLLSTTLPAEKILKIEPSYRLGSHIDQTLQKSWLSLLHECAMLSLAYVDFG